MYEVYGCTNPNFIKKIAYILGYSVYRHTADTSVALSVTDYSK